MGRMQELRAQAEVDRTTGHKLRRATWIAVSVLAAACSVALGLVAGLGVIDLVSPVSDAPKTAFLASLAWPAYVFAKWAIESWRQRAGVAGPER